MRYSQIGQDVWVMEQALPDLRGGFFVDAGAFDGIRYSNTLLLARERAWRGVCIEAAPVAAANLRAARPDASVVAVALGGAYGERRFDASRGVLSRFSTEAGDVVPVVPLADVLAAARAPEVIDYLSVDIEGAEAEVLLPFLGTAAYAFRCATIEVTCSRPERAALEASLAAHGYEIIGRFFSDWFVVHRGLLPEYACPESWFTEVLLRRLPRAMWVKPEVASVPWVEALTTAVEDGVA